MIRGNGGLAQLARALAWHARGHEFDSRILHNLKGVPNVVFGTPFALPGLDYRNIGLDDRNVAREDRNSYLFSLTKMLSGRFFPKLSCRTSSPHSRPGQSAGSPKACLTTVSPRTAEYPFE